MNARVTLSACSAAALAACAGLLIAGPLDPPAGPVASSFKTLAEVEPRTAINAANTPGDSDSSFKITQPGTYFLTGDVSGVSGKHGLEVSASGVVIDLGGFSIVGVAGPMNGVHVEPGSSVADVSIVSGSISGWAGRAIGMSQVPGARVRDLAISGGVVGAELGARASVENCAITGSDHGANVGTGSVVRDCTVTGAGVEAITTGSGSLVEGCVVRQSATGIQLNGRGSIARGCTVSGGTIGIAAGIGAGESDATIEACIVTGSLNLGIRGGVGSRIVGNAVAGSMNVGIWTNSYSLVEGNSVRDTRNASGSGAGILVGGIESRVSIRNNTIANNDKGIRVTTGGNAIYSNQLTSNTQPFDLAASNRVGPISSGTLTPGPITGTTGGNGMGSTDPFANILY